MTTAATSIKQANWTEVTVEVCGGPVAVAQAGSGPAVFVLPRDNGHAPGNEFLDRLAAEFSISYPWYPGFDHGEPAAWEWLTNPRDLAVVMRQLAPALGLDAVSVVGLGFGGWIAAEMATTWGPGLERLVLVSPMGVKPENGYIYDQFIVSTEHYARAMFHDEAKFEAIYGAEPDFDQLAGWETDREMASRIGWKPYMYNVALPRLLSGVTAPALIVAGADDQVVPAECAEIYRASLPNATLETVPACGHAVDLEFPDVLAAKVAAFLKR
ncbi:MAG: alpha/beta hydrolase [Chloroflexi bacterium]|nr:alpha/beta hydrolase [Chloroflexota bacterium]